MLTTIEGTYREGQIELAERPIGLVKARVIVTFLPDEQSNGDKPSNSFIRYGQFAGSRLTNEEDFRIAEWRGESED